VLNFSGRRSYCSRRWRTAVGEFWASWLLQLPSLLHVINHLWKELILEYCRSQRIYIVSLEQDFPLFSNPVIESNKLFSSFFFLSYYYIWYSLPANFKINRLWVPVIPQLVIKVLCLPSCVFYQHHRPCLLGDCWVGFRIFCFLKCNLSAFLSWRRIYPARQKKFSFQLLLLKVMWISKLLLLKARQLSIHPGPVGAKLNEWNLQVGDSLPLRWLKKKI
jgi:hypothetical protein